MIYEGVCACHLRAIAAAAPVHTAAGFQAACPPAEGVPGGALGAIAAVTCAAIRNGGLQEEAEEVHEVTTLLLEVRPHAVLTCIKYNATRRANGGL
jgi:hypothetical protein